MDFEPEIKVKKERNIRVSPHSKVAKYYKNIKKGLTKTESAIRAGYADGTHTSVIETTKGFQQLSIKDSLLEETTLKELSVELLKNVRQDVDRGAKNKAIELAMNRIEPNQQPVRESEKVLIILKG